MNGSTVVAASAEADTDGLAGRRGRIADLPFSTRQHVKLGYAEIDAGARRLAENKARKRMCGSALSIAQRIHRKDSQIGIARIVLIRIILGA